MPQLTRQGTSRLLRTVDNKRHATEDDHEASIQPRRKSPKLSLEEDYGRDPESSSESEAGEQDHTSRLESPANTDPVTLSTRITKDYAKPQSRSNAKQSKKIGYGKRKTESSSAPTKLAFNGSRDSDSNDIFGEMGTTTKRPKTAIYGKAAASSVQSDQKRNVVNNQSSSSRSSKRVSKPGFKSPAQLKDTTTDLGRSGGFKVPKANEQFHGSTSAATKPTHTFKAVPDLPEDDLTPTVRQTRRLRSREMPIDPDPIEQLKFKPVRGLSSLDLSDLNDTAREVKTRQPLQANEVETSINEVDDEEGLDEPQDLSDNEPDETTCPYCDEIITDTDLVQKLKRARTMNVSKQAAFCQSHRQAEAKRQWDERGYPNIQWDVLPSRIERFKPQIMSIISNKQESIFRDRIAAKIASGNHRSMLQALNNDASSMDSLTPGYYGGKGARIISNQLMTSFSEEIRKRAGQDKVIGAAGASGFVQAVLVPEVALLLIAEDLNIDEGEAQTVMEKSSGLGNLLFEGEDEERSNRRRDPL